MDNIKKLTQQIEDKFDVDCEAIADYIELETKFYDDGYGYYDSMKMILDANGCKELARILILIAEELELSGKK